MNDGHVSFQKRIKFNEIIKDHPKLNNIPNSELISEGIKSEEGMIDSS